MMSNDVSLTNSLIKPHSRWTFFRHIHPGLFLAILVILLAMAFSIFPGLFTSYSPIDEVGPHLSAPSLQHWLGTNQLGQDLYTRVVYGSIHSLSGAIIAVAFGFIIGSLLGLFAGALSGITETIVMRMIDVLLSIPSLLLSLTMITLLGFGTVQIAIAVGVTSIAGFARLTRAEVARIRYSEYIEAAYGSGATFLQVLYRHIIPNVFYMVIGYATLQFGHALLQIATLSFLGYGVQAPTPEWGLLIAEGRDYIATSWWLTVTPGLFVIIVVLAANRISRAIVERGAA